MARNTYLAPPGDNGAYPREPAAKDNDGNLEELEEDTDGNNGSLVAAEGVFGAGLDDLGKCSGVDVLD